MLDDHVSGREDLSRQIWGLLTFTLWFDRYAAVGAPAPSWGRIRAMANVMPDTIDALFAFIFAGAVVWTLVPATETLARRHRAIDDPNERSLHEVPTPKLGGLAVLVAVLIGGSIFLPWDQETRSILAGAIVITAVGVIDDLVDLPAGLKLLGQIGAAIIPVASGVTVDNFTLPFLGRVDPGSVELFDPPGSARSTSARC